MSPAAEKAPAWENIPADVVHDHRSKTHTAQIAMAAVPEGWAFAASCSRLTGGLCGWGEGLGRRHGAIHPDRLSATEDEALAGAIALIRSRLQDPTLDAWLDSLAPSQPDLFSGARNV